MKKGIAIICVISMLLLMTACGTPLVSQEVATKAPQVEATPAAAAPDAAGDAAPEAAPQPGGAFDSYERPRVVAEGLKVGYMYRQADADSQIRMLQQTKVEAAHRGWTLVDVCYEVDTNFRDSFQNLLNQDVDAIVLTSTETTEAKQDLIEQARNAGIGVYSLDNQVVPGIICNTTMPNGVAIMELAYKVGSDYMWELNCAAITGEGQLNGRERGYPLIGFLNGVYPSFKLLEQQDISSSTLSMDQIPYEVTQTWLQKYGDELQCVFSPADYFSIYAAEAISKNGDPTGEKTFTVGIDGGAQAWSYIRNNTPFTYSYAQPFEMFAHNVCEIIDSIQVKGLNPGDEGCLIGYSGEVVYSTGKVITRENCPAVGDSIHAMFDYYDAENTEAWYNWNDGPGVYTIGDYAA